jgi:hypothetical protein
MIRIGILSILNFNIIPCKRVYWFKELFPKMILFNLRELMLMNEHWEEEWNLTQSLEILTDKLQKALLDLEIEKKKTDK